MMSNIEISNCSPKPGACGLAASGARRPILRACRTGSRRAGLGILAGLALALAGGAALPPPAAALAPKVQTAQTERRVALVIGNSHYRTLPQLPNPSNDVTEVAKILKKAGFDVTLGLDTDRLSLEEAVRTFLRSADGAHAGLIYYSGHAVQIGGQNFIVPVDATLESAYDVETQTMPLDLIVGHLREKSSIQLVFLDACRNNPFKTGNFWMAQTLEPVGPTRGLARIDSNLGSLIAFSTAPGEVALDGDGMLSPYTQFFVQHADVPNKEIRQVLTEVRRDVISATKGAQVPWENSSLLDSFYFFQAPSPPLLASLQQQTVPAGAADAKLSLEMPQAPTGAPLKVMVEQVPQVGRIVLDGKPLAPKTEIALADLQRLRFDSADASPGSVALFGYSASDPYGQRVQSVVAVSVVKDAAAEQAEEARKREERTNAVRSYLATLASMKVSPTIGVGRVALPIAPLPAALADQVFSVVEVPAKGVMTANGRPLSAGHALATGDLAALAYEPAIGTQETSFRLTLKADDAEAAITLTPALDACDMRAAAPLDLQGVAAGLLPNEIDGPAAIAACRKAIGRFPSVARFIYQLGRGELAARDARAAAVTFEKALAAGHVRAGEALSSLYQLGALGKPDMKKSADLAAQAAERGDPYALYNYGRSLYHGRGVEQDRKRGMELMIQAAELGHTYAMNELGGIFLKGNGIAADPARAIRYYESGVERQDIYSMNNLALVYRFGTGVAADEAKALALFKQAADGGQPYAPTNIGRMYRDGIGTDRNETEAARWLEIAAERGDYWGALDRAQLALGRGGADGQSVAARYLALATALQSLQGGANQDNQAETLLAGLPVAAKKDAEKILREDLTAAEQTKALSGAKTPDERLRQLAGAGWTKRNPRYDLF